MWWETIPNPDGTENGAVNEVVMALVEWVLELLVVVWPTKLIV